MEEHAFDFTLALFLSLGALENCGLVQLPVEGTGGGEEGALCLACSLLFYICLPLSSNSSGTLCFVEIIFKTEKKGGRTNGDQWLLRGKCERWVRGVPEAEGGLEKNPGAEQLPLTDRLP